MMSISDGYKNIQSVRGMHDCLIEDALLQKHIENVLKTIANSYGYNEIRLPIVEFTELFKRSIGEITDVVEKEMYTFNDRNGDSLTLRPEGTSGCVRAGIQHSLFYHQEQRLWNLGAMFRRERPQKGRYRQFHQFSVEAFGKSGPDIDAELILIAARCWKELGIDRYVFLEINSIGMVESRIVYRKRLIEFLEKNRHYLDCNAVKRLYSNPMRILDTKNNKIKALLVNAPMLGDYIDDSSKFHFIQLCKLLDIAGVSYIINPHLVRGLDYYNRTVFEWVTDNLGIRKTICAGGRYDDLVKRLGGKKTVPAAGFSIGLERVALLMHILKKDVIFNKMYIDIYFAYIGAEAQKCAILLSEEIRKKILSLRLMLNHGGGNLKQQCERAKKVNSKFLMIIKEQNVSERTVILKDFKSGLQECLKYDEVVTKLRNILI